MDTPLFDRRRFLKWSTASLSALGLCGVAPFSRRALAAPPTNDRKLLFIFLRGGIDAVQTVIPFGDAGIPGKGILDYRKARPRLAVEPAKAHDLNGFASLNPVMHDDRGGNLPKLLDIFEGRVDERGRDLAIVQRVGYECQNHSHFSSQQFWENADVGNVNLEVGVFNRYFNAYKNPQSPMQAVAMSGNQMVMMKGSRGKALIPVLRSIKDFSLPSNVTIGTKPSAEDPLGSGLLGAYSRTDFDSSRPYESLTYATGSTLLESVKYFKKNVHQVSYAPQPNAQPFYDAIANRDFARYVSGCARLLKQVDGLQVAGCNQTGYDTHGSQGARFPALVRDLALALTALYHDLKPIWKKTLVVTMSEFGRTSQENGNCGTDHGEATCMFLMGGAVNGGLYNCDRATWDHGDLFSTANRRYVAHRTDFRAIYHEIFTKHLGDPGGHIDEIIPGYSKVSGGDTKGYFNPLGLIG